MKRSTSMIAVVLAALALAFAGVLFHPLSRAGSRDEASWYQLPPDATFPPLPTLERRLVPVLPEPGGN